MQASRTSEEELEGRLLWSASLPTLAKVSFRLSSCTLKPRDPSAAYWLVERTRRVMGGRLYCGSTAVSRLTCSSRMCHGMHDDGPLSFHVKGRVTWFEGPGCGACQARCLWLPGCWQGSSRAWMETMQLSGVVRQSVSCWDWSNVLAAVTIAEAANVQEIRCRHSAWMV